MAHSIYVIDLDTGEVKTTNNVELVDSFVECDNYVVLLPQYDVFFLGSRKEQEVVELKESDETEEFNTKDFDEDD